MSMEGHYYVVTKADGSEENVPSVGWVNVNDDLILQNEAMEEAARFPKGEWTAVRPMPTPEGQDPS